MTPWYDDSWRDGYDAWKLRAPDWDDPPESEFVCSACEDLGLMLGPDDEVIPCTECSQSVDLFDLEEFRG